MACTQVSTSAIPSAGDLVAEASGIGYGLSALGFAGLIAVTAFAYYVLKVNGILAFWTAYVLTRPLGASMGDLLSQSHQDGGLGLGTTATSAIFLLVILSLVTYLSITHRDFIPEPVESDVPAQPADILESTRPILEPDAG